MKKLYAGVSNNGYDGTFSGCSGRSQSIYDELRHDIIGLKLPPGYLLRSKDIAERYGVSISPVREALQKLQQDTLVDIQPQSRTSVSRISLSSLKSAYVLRLALETEVTVRLVEQGHSTTLDPAKRAVHRHAGAASAGVDQACRKAGRSFHEALFRAANCSGLSAFLERKYSPLRRIDFLIKGPREIEIVEAHDKILRRIQMSDHDGATSVMRHHIDTTSRSVAAAVHKFPNYFCP